MNQLDKEIDRVFRAGAQREKLIRMSEQATETWLIAQGLWLQRYRRAKWLTRHRLGFLVRFLCSATMAELQETRNMLICPPPREDVFPPAVCPNPGHQEWEKME